MKKNRMCCHHEGALGFKSQEMMRKLGFTLGKPAQLVSENFTLKFDNYSVLKSTLSKCHFIGNVLCCQFEGNVSRHSSTVGVMGLLPTWCTQGAKTWVFPSCQEG